MSAQMSVMVTVFNQLMTMYMPKGSRAVLLLSCHFSVTNSARSKNLQHGTVHVKLTDWHHLMHI